MDDRVKMLLYLRGAVRRLSSDDDEVFARVRLFVAYVNKYPTDEFAAAASALFFEIVQKQRAAMTALRAVELRRKRKSRHLLFLYIFETLAFVSTLVSSWIGLLTDISAAKIIACMSGSLISLCALLFFHVREYARVDKLVRLLSRKD